MSVKKQLDEKKIIESNPKIDAEKLSRARQALRALQELGIKKSEYNLVRPFSRKRSVLPEGEGLATRRLSARR